MHFVCKWEMCSRISLRLCSCYGSALTRVNRFRARPGGSPRPRRACFHNQLFVTRLIFRPRRDYDEWATAGGSGESFNGDRRPASASVPQFLGAAAGVVDPIYVQLRGYTARAVLLRADVATTLSSLVRSTESLGSRTLLGQLISRNSFVRDVSWVSSYLLNLRVPVSSGDSFG